MRRRARWITAIGGDGTNIDVQDGQDRIYRNGRVRVEHPSVLTEREKAIAGQILKEIGARLDFLLNVGLDYLTLSRTASTLSGGEAQRIRLATQIGSGLMGVLYVCDEPSIGLHPADDYRLIQTLKGLRDLGNTVLIVEHDEAIMRAADYIVDLGPGAGEHGGHVVATGPVEDIIAEPRSITGQYLGGTRQIPLPETRREGNGERLVIRGAAQNNLKDIDVEIPLGMFVCVTGVSGSGKSTLINEILYKKLAQQFYRARDRAGAVRDIEGIEHIDKVVDIDQSPIGRTPRSNPATYTDTFTPIREVYAKVPESRMRGLQAGAVLVQREGRALRGLHGGRAYQYRDAVFAGRDGAVRDMRGEAVQPGGAGDLLAGREYRGCAGDDGYGGAGHLREYPACAEAVADASGRGAGVHTAWAAGDATERGGGAAGEAGEGAVEAGDGADAVHPGRAYHRAYRSRTARICCGCLQRLVDAGNTVVLIEHHLDLIKSADWLIDLGPGAGDRGGELIAEGTPEDVARMAHSQTGQYLSRLLGVEAAVSAAD